MNIKIAYFLKSKECKKILRSNIKYCSYVRHNNGNSEILIMFFTYVLCIHISGLEKNKKNYIKIF